MANGAVVCFLLQAVHVAVGYPSGSEGQTPLTHAQTRRQPDAMLPLDPLSVEFPSGARLTPVPVSSVDSSFRDPFQEFAETMLPDTQLFDYTGIENLPLSDSFQVINFLPLNSLQYFRLSPRLVECLQRVEDESGRALFVQAGYRQDPDVVNETFPDRTSRSRHVRGRGADVRFLDGVSDLQSFLVLAGYLVDVCYPLFISYGAGMGLGLLKNGIHVNFFFGTEVAYDVDGWSEDTASMSTLDWTDWCASRRVDIHRNITQTPSRCQKLGVEQFRCRSGLQCAQPQQVCDGVYDCGPDDNSDELGMSYACGRNSESATSAPPPTTTTTTHTEVLVTGGGGIRCFPGSATVLTADSGPKPLRELQMGERVQSVNSVGEVVYSPVIAFTDKMPRVSVDYVKLETENGFTIMLTPGHLIFRNNGNSSADENEMETVFASDISPGDTLYTVDSSGNQSLMLAPSKVATASTVKDVGAYGPLTTEGTVVVDGVAASCYALFNHQGLVHASFAPLRYLNALFPRAVATEQEGLHWYPELLRAIGRYTYMSQPFGSELLYPGVSL